MLRSSRARNMGTRTTGLVARTERVRLEATRRLDPDRRSELGQFLTPPAVASFMASMFRARGEELRLLDPGAGVGSLTAAFVERVSARGRVPRRMSVLACEIDPALSGGLTATLNDCRRTAKRAGTSFSYGIKQRDFIELAAEMLRGGPLSPAPPTFNCAILNPPYHKIHSASRHRRLLSELGIETTNLYAAFLAIAVRMLEPGGELVAITPRSFCNGPYFERFRKSFLREMTLVRIHVYDRRDSAFHDDRVTQENVIMHALKPRTACRVSVTGSASPTATKTTRRRVEPSEVVHHDDPREFIRVVGDESAQQVADRIREFAGTIEELGLSVSTGRVVDFRAARHLRVRPTSHTAPLVYPSHFSGGFVRWPDPANRKPNALAVTAKTERLLLPAGTYVVVRRFSAKEEPRRIVAAIYEPSRVSMKSVGFENHLNVYHRRGSGLPPGLARGLARYLNSSLVDAYFRQFSGHTQVNATDLRSLPYPSLGEIEILGTSQPNRALTTAEIDRLVEQGFASSAA